MQSIKRHNKGLPFFKVPRAIKARYKIIRIFMSALLIIVFVSATPVQAIETTKASALVLQEMRERHSLSFTKKSLVIPQADPCRTLLQLSSASPSANSQGVFALSNTQPHAGKTAASVTLSLFLGVRLALGPQEVVKNAKRVKIGPEFRLADNSNDNRALAVAAYRSCKNNHTLSLQKKNK